MYVYIYMYMYICICIYTHIFHLIDVSKGPSG